ncbi:hypothetical protein [Luethyella okanaganae]|uniref:Lipoprotein n=1 Tax=Luethyella okanaganae TaxID=69372 RepID=A0ABW1VEX5_9MICO
MRLMSRGITAALVGVVLLVMGVAGCVKTPVQPPVSTTDAPAPVFASDEEALAAAEEAYAAYLAVGDEISKQGGDNPERYAQVSKGQALESALKSAGQFREARAHTFGDSTYSTYKLQLANYANVETLEILVYVCDDVSSVDVLGEDGVSIVSPDRPDKTPFVVEFDHKLNNKLILSRKDLWEGETFCD